MKNLSKIKEIYHKGGNIIKYLKNLKSSSENDVLDILISYDFQAGSYIEIANNNPEYIENYTTALSAYINNLGNFESIIEVGVGEATTLIPVINKLHTRPADILGLDISLSRILFAKKYAIENKISHIKFFVSDLFSIALRDNSVDIVFTSHAIEPNGGKEKEALEELYRITKKYLILLEPIYEFASEIGKKRMTEMGYIKNLYKTAVDLGYKVILYKEFDFVMNDLNPTGILIIEKDTDLNKSNSVDLVCPLSHTELIQHNNCSLYSKSSLLAYPIIKNIPILLSSNAIIATHLNEFD